MKLPVNLNLKLAVLAAMACVGIVCAVLFWNPATPVSAQNSPVKTNQPVAPTSAAETARTNAPAPAVAPEPSINVTAAVVVAAAPPAAASNAATLAAPAPAPGPAAPASSTNSSTNAAGQGSSDEIQLSFQGANVDMVVQWLAKTTGKSVVKHPRVQCQLTIVSSKKLAARDAINLVYRALQLEGFTALESSKSILIVPDGQEPKISPELLDAGQTEVPEGRQRLTKIFTLKHIQPADLSNRIRAVLSEKATVDVADRARQLIVTDYNDNMRVVMDLIRELDVPAGGDIVVEFFSLKFSDAEELGNLISLVLNAQPLPPSPSPSPSRPSSSSTISRSVSMPPGMSSPQPPSSPEPSPGTSSSSSGASSAAGQPVRIWPDKTANRLIVAAPKSKMAEVQKLIDLLDTEKPQDVSVRVLPLKNVSAEDLVRELGPLFVKMGGKSAKDVIEVSANTRANSLIVFSSEANFRTIEKLVSTLDTEEAQERVMQAFDLRNADAEDVAKQLQDLHSDQESGMRYPYVIFSSSAMGRSAKKPTFVADRRRNTVIAQASPSVMENVARLIKELDEPVTDNNLAPRIFRLKYVSATDIEDVLNELFLKRPQQRTYWDPYGFQSQDRSEQQSGRLYGKVRITSEPYANAIIVTANSPESLGAVEEVLKDLDVPSQAGESTMRLGLRFAKAASVANSINILFARGGSPPLRPTPPQGQPNVQAQQQQQQANAFQNSFELDQDTKEEAYFPWLGGNPENLRGVDGRNATRPVSDLVGRVRVVADHRSNALLISANLHLLPEVLRLVQELDAPTAQVLIEAKILEVSTDFLDKLGVRYSPNGGATFTPEDLDNSVLARLRGEHVTEFGGRSTVLAKSLNSMRSGVLDSTISLDFLIQFLRRTTDASVLAEPQINIADNEVGKLFVGQQVPFIDKSQSTDVGALNQSFSYKNVGIILEVTPHINSAGDVALKVRAESSSIVPGQTLFGGAILDTRNFKTDLTVRNGETVVLGGIIQRQVSDTLRKTPGLGSIPGLGWAFKKKDANRRSVELMVFLKTKVVRTPEEARELLDEMDRKTPLIRRWRDEVRPNGREEQSNEDSRKPD